VGDYYSPAEGVRSIAMSVSVSLSVCLTVSVCQSARVSQKPHVQSSRNFPHMLCGVVTRSPSDKNGICYGPCPVSERLAKQKFSHWGFPVKSNKAEFFLLSCLANRSLTGQHPVLPVFLTTSFSHNALCGVYGIGNVYLSAVLEQVVINFQRIRQRRHTVRLCRRIQ